MAEVEKAVKRPHWEPRHEWESRIKFVEDNMADHGLEKAVTLSIVWANMKFLGCSYPPGTEKLVASYPVPPLEELKARRKAKEALERGQSCGDCPTSPKRAKLDDTVSDVSSLISSIRTQSEKNQQSSFIPEYDEELSKTVPPIVQTVANAICMCKECIGQNGNGATERATLMLQKYADSKDSTFSFEFREDTVVQAFSSADGYKCALLINGELVIEKLTVGKDESKGAVSAEFLKMADDWQEACGKPPCPNLARHVNSQPQRAYEYGQYTPSRYERDQGNVYNHRQGGHYNSWSSNEHGSRYSSSEYYMPPPQGSGRGGRGYGGRGGYQYRGPRY